MILYKISALLLSALVSLACASSNYYPSSTRLFAEPWFGPSLRAESRHSRPAREDKPSSHCQEIPAKESTAGAGAGRHGDATCYRCTDPQNGSSYEHCSYASGSRAQPESLGSASRQSKRSARLLPGSDREAGTAECEKVARDSMLCTVCQGPGNSGNYEQCSYVAEPEEKAYAYSKSSSFGQPKTREQIVQEARAGQRRAEGFRAKAASEPVLDHLHYEHESTEPKRKKKQEEKKKKPENKKSQRQRDSSEEEEEEEEGGHLAHDYHVPEYSYHYPRSYRDYGEGSADKETAEEESSPSTKANCKTVSKDGQSCTVCTNPKTGGKSENCQYAHDPKDKVYKYSKSKSFGYPEFGRSSYHNDEGEGKVEEEEEEDAPVSKERLSNSSRQEGDASAENYSGEEDEEAYETPSESERVSEKVRRGGDGACEEVRRDGMICTVCKDPKTGGDFERCNYSYEPEDKVYAYSKSKSFGSPEKGASSYYDAGDDGSGSSSSSSEEQPEESFSAPAVTFPTSTSALDYQPRSSNVFPTSTSALDYQPRTSESRILASTARPRQDSRVDLGYYDAKVRRDEIEKIVKDIDTVDKSKCQKTRRGGMTCYRCADDKGTTNEECVYVAEPEGTATTSVTSSSSSSSSSPATRSRRETREAAAKSSDGDESKEEKPEEEQLDEAEPYEFVDETRPVYDKVLGLTLPAYMVERSAHEIEFDEAVEKARF